MKKILLLLCLFISCSVFADAKDTLKERLAKIDGFYAQFTQVVSTADNQLIQEGNGEFWLNRPNYFNWQLNQPDKTTIVSDGKDIWIYMPEVEQVTVMSLKQAVDNRLLLLITDSKSEVWLDYQVEQNEDSFTLKPINATQQSYIIRVLATGTIVDFTIVEEDGQQSFYQLSHQKLGQIDSKKFIFTVPDDVIIDDQR